MNILIPSLSDIEKILELNNRYLFTNLNETQKQGGFIRIKYTENDLKKIILNQEIVVAKDDNKLVGYYLIGKKSDSIDLEYQQHKASNFAIDNMILIEKIGYGCQVCIHSNYRNNGLSRRMLDALLGIVNHKYIYLLSTISVENKVSLINSTSIGWKLLNEFETPQYYIYKV